MASVQPFGWTGGPGSATLSWGATHRWPGTAPGGSALQRRAPTFGAPDRYPAWFTDVDPEVGTLDGGVTRRSTG